MAFENCTKWLSLEIAAAVAVTKANWRCRCAIKELSGLSDALLADVGLRRHEIGAYCRSVYLARAAAPLRRPKRPMAPTTSIGTDIWCTVFMLGPH
jgi:uncharacterized protein YjiS (DUF1127 family)